MFTNNTHKITLTIILSLYSSCHLSTVLAMGKDNREELSIAKLNPSEGAEAAVVVPQPNKDKINNYINIAKNKVDIARKKTMEPLERLKEKTKGNARTQNKIEMGMEHVKRVMKKYIEHMKQDIETKTSNLKGSESEIDMKHFDTSFEIAIKDFDEDCEELMRTIMKYVEDIYTEHEAQQNKINEKENNLKKTINELKDQDPRTSDLKTLGPKTLDPKASDPKASDPEASDPEIQDEIKQKAEELKQTQKTIDQQNRLAVIKEQEKLRIAQAPIEAQTYAVQNIAAAIQSSVVSNIVNTRMNINQYDIRTSEDENKPVAAGSQIVDAYIAPKSWDIWAGGHMGNIKQDAANATSANSKTDFYGGTIGIDKIFANTSVFGLALSYGKSNTEYTSKTSTGVDVNEKWASNYYQTDIYAHHNFTDNLFFQLIGGIGTYGDDTTIGNMFDFSSQKFTFGYHGNATIGYSIFGGEDSNFVITPKLSAAYYHLNIPDSIIGKPDSSTFTTLDRVDGVAGLNIKILNLNSDSNSNVKIIPEVTAAMKFRFHDKVNGINADNIKLPVVKSASSNDLSANALASPEQLFTLGGALTVTNNNFSVSLHGSFDFAKQYLAMVGGISVKLSF